MNGRTFRALAIAAALLTGGAVTQSSAHAQTSSADSAKPADSSTQTPAAVYGKMTQMMISELVSAAEAMPADKYNFAPTAGKFDGVRTFGGQIQHLIGANYFFFSGFGLSGAPDEAKIKGLKSKDELVQALKDSIAYAQKGIDTMTPENSFAEVSMGKEKMARAAVATLYLAHSMDHYGQMVEYLRMNGIVPPASQKQGM
jgi:uncharacterized damage-inducible protein DinB